MAPSVKILSIDDDESLLLFIQRNLESQGHKVTTTADPEQVERFLDRDFDLILLDVNMPGRSGWEILDQLRDDPRTTHTPVMMLSARTDVEDRVRALRAGADDYLVKPFAPEELIARIETIVERRVRSFHGLQGNLESNPFLELMQNFWQSSKSGTLELVASGRSGSVEIRRGRMIRAEFGSFADREALVAMCELRQGTFRFIPLSASETIDDSVKRALPLQNVLMEVAWLKDELLRRPAKLPEKSDGLRFVKDVGAIPEDLSHLPMVEVAARIGAQPGVTLAHLFALEIAAPLKIRLSVAWLAEQGVIQFKTRSPSDVAVS